ncbi:MAG: hypothetical protein A3A24_01750 [Candidatus Buchananbacteria bacterium RIFCSPLOWO2_01_FULL_46_12]|uniref:Uncharacterized protein n=2 Tax=Candidatus Buchananiibacteriota TaxID=1817903 RepID=A0A1G1YPX7_9BACT|nr:MAG: hypothetical protein A2744_02965 [Candidatus Buchananbacteria bacterium RIFCSPHIGHO2_01_FULL_44_11]OGY53487.1 MAG: hypothetical protein A3A24_01750 [Candidatus Buchananbacteria bacterium RIFCSPLOWO2_01_FULL_46_12]
MQPTSNKLGALWVNEPKSEKGPVLSGEIDGQRVVGFKNKKWSEAEQKKQPLYQLYRSIKQVKEAKA